VVGNFGHGEVSNRAAGALVLVAAVTVAAFVAGCGGGSSAPPSEGELKARIEAGISKFVEAESGEVVETVENTDTTKPHGEPMTAYCAIARVEPGATPRYAASQTFGPCEGEAETREVIAIGNQVWDTIEPGKWTGGTIDPKIVEEVGHGAARFRKLVAAAQGLHEVSAEGGSGTSYLFTAPAGSFFETARNPHLKLTFVVGLDQDGYLQKLVATAVEDPVKEVIALNYAHVGEPQHIAPPPPAEVTGPLIRVETRKEFEALIGPDLEDAGDEAEV
jgi:hypothetical protein